jgi:epoxyqueuosine reductase
VVHHPISGDRPADARSVNAALAQAVCDAGRAAGLVAVGIAGAEPFEHARRVLLERREAGLSGGMQFTYRNPERSCDPSRTLSGVRSLVVGAWPYPGGTLPNPTSRRPMGRVARYATDDHYAGLRRALEVMAVVLGDAGYAARVLADDNALVDRAAAHRAGIGWWGRNANLLVPGHGSWVVLGSVLTDAALPVADGPQPDGCGTCRRCSEGCPTGAIVGPGVVDARRCLAWLVQAPGALPSEFRVALGDRVYGCDDCQEVCPPGRRAPGADDAGDGSWVDLIQLCDASDAELLDRHGRWYIAERDPAYLRRNALVALGNAGDPADPEVVRVVTTYLAHPAPMLRAHAVWAARRLGREDLLGALEGVDAPEVAAELAAAAPPPR